MQKGGDQGYGEGEAKGEDGPRRVDRDEVSHLLTSDKWVSGGVGAEGRMAQICNFYVVVREYVRMCTNMYEYVRICKNM